MVCTSLWWFVADTYIKYDRYVESIRDVQAKVRWSTMTNSGGLHLYALHVKNDGWVRQNPTVLENQRLWRHVMLWYAQAVSNMVKSLKILR